MHEYQNKGDEKRGRIEEEWPIARGARGKRDGASRTHEMVAHNVYKFNKIIIRLIRMGGKARPACFKNRSRRHPLARTRFGLASELPTILKVSHVLSDSSSKRLSTVSQCARVLGVYGTRGPLFQHRLREGCSWRGVRAHEPTNNQGIRRYNGRRR